MSNTLNIQSNSTIKSLKIPKLKKQINIQESNNNIEIPSNTCNLILDETIEIENKENINISNNTIPSNQRKSISNDTTMSIENQLDNITLFVRQKFMSLDEEASTSLLLMIEQLKNQVLQKRNSLPSNDESFQYNFEEGESLQLPTGVIHWDCNDDDIVVMNQGNPISHFFSPSAMQSLDQSGSSDLMATVVKRTPSNQNFVNMSTRKSAMKSTVAIKSRSSPRFHSKQLDMTSPTEIVLQSIEPKTEIKSRESIETTKPEEVSVLSNPFVLEQNLFLNTMNSPQMSDLVENIETLTMSDTKVSSSPIKQIRRRGRRASVGGAKLAKRSKSIDDDEDDITTSTVNEQEVLIESEVISTSPKKRNVTDADTKPLRRSSRRLSIGDANNTNELESFREKTPPSEKVSDDSFVFNNPIDDFEENYGVLMMDACMDDYNANNNTTFDSLKISMIPKSDDQVSTNIDIINIQIDDFQRLIVDLFSTKKGKVNNVSLSTANGTLIYLFASFFKLDICQSSNSQQLISIIKPLLKNIQLLSSYDNDKQEVINNSKKVRFCSVDGSCVSPPNDRRPESWMNTFHNAQLFIEKQDHYSSLYEYLHSHDLLTIFMDTIQGVLFKTASASSLRDMIISHTSFHDIWSESESKICLQILKDELLSHIHLYDSSLKCRTSWMFSSVIRYHLRWLLDPSPTEISVAAIATKLYDPENRSSFYKVETIEDSCKHFIISLEECEDIYLDIEEIEEPKKNKGRVPSSANVTFQDIELSYSYILGKAVQHLNYFLDRVFSKIIAISNIKHHHQLLQLKDLTVYVEQWIEKECETNSHALIKCKKVRMNVS